MIGRTGVYRVFGPQPKGDAPIVGMASWGQGTHGAAGYEDHGESALFLQPVTPEKCRDIMTKNPACCLATDTASQAARLMKKHDVGLLPVVANTRSKKLIGVVTDRDLVLKVMAADLDPAATVVELAFSVPAITCSPDDPLAQALRLMERCRIKRVLVVDNRERVVGVISESDVALRLRDQEKTAELLESISQPDPTRV